MASQPLNLAKLQKGEEDHKYSHGHALVLSGAHTHTGAARLAARGALRIGAGLVTIGAPQDAMSEHASQLNAIMLRKITTAEALIQTLQDPRFTGLCLGPALGLDDRAVSLVAAAVSSAERGSAPRPAIVLDADALTILGRRPDLQKTLHSGCVLTPHAGEFKRLWPDLRIEQSKDAQDRLTLSKADAARQAAAQSGAVVVFKGPKTVIAHPDGRVITSAASNDRAAPWLATAGSGDVLAGFITGLLARGFAPIDAAELATWLHVECARSFGPGLIAEDLPEELPKVLRKVLTAGA